MEKFIPTGHMMLVKTLTTEYHTTENKIELVENNFQKVEVVEVPTIAPHKDTYKAGDILLISSGAGHLQYYNNQSCLWINCKGVPEGDVWCIITETEK